MWATCERNKVKCKAVFMFDKEPYRERILDNGYIHLRVFLTLILASTVYSLDCRSEETGFEDTENEANTRFRVK